VIIVVSLITAAPEKAVQEMVDHVRFPHLKGSVATQID
jgi:hypothetical protein